MKALSLVREARRMCDVVVVSGLLTRRSWPGEDFERYPRDLTKDTALLMTTTSTTIFAPLSKRFIRRV